MSVHAKGADRERAGVAPVVSVSIAANHTMAVADLCRRWVFTLDAAREVDVAAMSDPAQWVELTNDAASLGDLTVKDGATTVDTLAAGESSRYAQGATGAVAPL